MLADQPDPDQELLRVLEHNGAKYTRNGREFRVIVESGLARWELVCRCREKYVIFYAAYPFPIGNADSFCRNVNRKLLCGAAIQTGDTVCIRTTATLVDTYTAFEAITEALEYNTMAIVKFWYDAKP